MTETDKVITCNKCGKTESERKDGSYNEAFYEFLSIEFTAGYGSDFWGDTLKVKVDLCEKCHFDLFRPFAKVRDSRWNGPNGEAVGFDHNVLPNGLWDEMNRGFAGAFTMEECRSNPIYAEYFEQIKAAKP